MGSRRCWGKEVEEDAVVKEGEAQQQQRRRTRLAPSRPRRQGRRPRERRSSRSCTGVVVGSGKGATRLLGACRKRGRAEIGARARGPGRACRPCRGRPRRRTTSSSRGGRTGCMSEARSCGDGGEGAGRAAPVWYAPWPRRPGSRCRRRTKAAKRRRALGPSLGLGRGRCAARCRATKASTRREWTRCSSGGSSG